MPEATEYGGVDIAVSYWWEAHIEDHPEPGSCKACPSDELSLHYYAEAAWTGLTAALWTATHHNGTSLETLGFAVANIDADVSESFAREAAEFCHKHASDLSGIEAQQVGHDFVLTRNGEGTGFWDRGLGARGDRLTQTCRDYGGFHLYIGDNNMLYAHN